MATRKEKVPRKFIATGCIVYKQNLKKKSAKEDKARSDDEG